MTCLLTTKALVESAVIHAVSVATGRLDLTSLTSLSAPPPTGLGLSPSGKQLLYFPIEKTIESSGCRLSGVTPGSCSGADTIGDLVSMVTSDLHAT
jgi:hypothetical protein